MLPSFHLKLIPVKQRPLRYRKITWGSEQMTPRVNTGYCFIHVFLLSCEDLWEYSKQIITAFSFLCLSEIIPSQCYPNASGSGYLLKKKTMPLIPKNMSVNPEEEELCTVSISLYKPRNTKVYDTGIRIVPSPNDCRITSWY